MDTNSTLNYRLYVQRQDEFIRADYHAEFRQYNKIKNGDVEGVRERFKIARKNFFKRKRRKRYSLGESSP